MGKVIVVGGGAAGMMAALAAAENGARVCLIEKNEKLGKKLFLTGKGRCNVTNAGDEDTFFSNICTNPKFLYSSFYGYDNRAVMKKLEEAGCPLKTERGGRVFPVSDHAYDVTAALQRELKKRRVEILLNTEVEGLLVERDEDFSFGCVNEECGAGRGGQDASEDASLPRISGVRLSDGRTLAAESCVVCTGGLSYPSTGSTGDGYRFARETGHTVTERRPALVPLDIKEKWCADLMGLSLKNVSLRMVRGGREVYQGFGEMLFTHFGVSGPLILSASSFYSRGNRKQSKEKNPEDGETMLYIDLKPALDPEQLDRRLQREFDENRNKQFRNALGALFPAKMIPVMVDLSGIQTDKKAGEVTREERRAFTELIKRLPLTAVGPRGFGEAVITQGGVSVKDINPSTMESKRVRGMYFAGEVLDVDALTGGFNLQIAWSTGYMAGKSAAECVMKFQVTKGV